jgi:hypothetical protein
MEKVEKKNSLSFFSINKLSRKSKALLHTGKQLNKNFAHKKQLESLDINVNSIGTQVLPSNNSNLQQVTCQNSQFKGVHSYFSFGRAEPKIKSRSNQNKSQALPRTETLHPTPSAENVNISGRNKNPYLLAFKIAFINQQQPPILLNVSAASYSEDHQAKHVLLLFVNGSSTFELLFKNNS